MNVLYFDCTCGISGDMTLGAFLDLGIDEAVFRRELAKLGVGGYRLAITKKQKNGVTGTDVDVILEEVENQPPRNLRDITALIDRSAIFPGAKETGKKIFREIAAAEARVHGGEPEDVTFHENGAVDSIVDIVGTAVCLDLLKPDRVCSSALHDGSGFIRCRRGMIPVPVPAVMEMLRGSGIPLVQTAVGTELVTPTGMGIIKCVSGGFGSMPAMPVERVGYGMGKREYAGLGALRLVLGTVSEPDGAPGKTTRPFQEPKCQRSFADA